METSIVRFFLDSDYTEQLDECGLDFIDVGDGQVLLTSELDASLVESLSAEELIEFLGIDAEALIYIEVID